MQAVALVTGAAGFAGSHLVDQLLESRTDVHALTRGAVPVDERPGVRWWRADVLDLDVLHRVVAAVRPSVVYHCAGRAHVHDAWKAPADALRVNVLGTHQLLHACPDAGLDCRVFISEKRATLVLR